MVSNYGDRRDAHPSRAETPRTSKLARRSRLASASTTSAALASELGPGAAASSSSLPGRARCQASNDSRISATVRDVSLSCLLASRSRGRFNKRGEVITSSWESQHTLIHEGSMWRQGNKKSSFLVILLQRQTRLTWMGRDPRSLSACGRDREVGVGGRSGRPSAGGGRSALPKGGMHRSRSHAQSQGV